MGWWGRGKEEVTDRGISIVLSHHFAVTSMNLSHPSSSVSL